jgi:hypothetical protein
MKSEINFHDWGYCCSECCYEKDLQGGTLKVYDERGRVVRDEKTRHKSFGRWCNAFFPP